MNFDDNTAIATAIKSGNINISTGKLSWLIL